MVIIDKTNFDAVYSLLERSFPPDERRSYEEQKKLLDEKEYKIYAKFDGDALVGFLATWSFGTQAYVEHFAVSPEFRNNGEGSRMLAETIKTLGVPVCLEVEKPEDELTTRRINFYKRNGFFLNLYPYIQPAYSPEKQPVPLLIMSTGANLTESEFKKIRSSLYKIVYKVE